ncbi:hypothetical protein BDN72DRAFT_169884 [Pluteus cervinus]|uniref:Uncharacterized protein n=1 Tax=Pluteus cervinus TaxID=181527 RepID=A0ACD3AJQ9_9AGAR|nr:hypothetical protein BDN72DRAFT_169884 [Pluteus cervinus]
MDAKKWTGVAAGPFGQELLNPNLNLNSTGGRKNFFAFFFCFCVCSRFLLAFAPSRNQKCLPSRRHCSCLHGRSRSRSGWTVWELGEACWKGRGWLPLKGWHVGVWDVGMLVCLSISGFTIFWRLEAIVLVYNVNGQRVSLSPLQLSCHRLEIQ